MATNISVKKGSYICKDNKIYAELCAVICNANVIEAGLS